MQLCLWTILLAMLLGFVREGSANAPVITYTPKDNVSQNYASLKLVCHAEGSPQPVISWHRVIPAGSGKSPPPDTRSVQTGSESQLVVVRPRPRETYTYLCNASNVHGYAESPPATVGLAFMGSHFVSGPPPRKTSLAGSTVSLSCQLPPGNPAPRALWFRDDRLFSSDSDSRVSVSLQLHGLSTLRIRAAQPRDSGQYHCEAVSELVKTRVISSACSLRIQSAETAPAMVRLKFSLGTTARLPCPIDAVEAGPVQWTRADERSSISEARSAPDTVADPTTGRTRHALRISVLQRTDAGRYICSAGGASAVVELVVQEPASFLRTPEQKTVLEGDDVVFQCVVAGYPLPKVYWELPRERGHVIPDEAGDNGGGQIGRFRVTTAGSLEIRNVQLSDAGKYTCNCHSSLDAQQTSAVLTVRRRELANYPVLSLPPQNQTLSQGSTATFRCEVVSHREAVISWYRGPQYEPLSPSTDPRVSIPTRGVLQLANIDPARDTNIYTCEARLPPSSSGLPASSSPTVLSTRWTALLRVLYPGSKEPLLTPVNDEKLLPLAPVISTPQQRTVSSITVSWTGESSPDNVYWVEYVRFGSPVGWRIYRKDWPGTELTVKGLQPSSWYQFLLRARNSRGLSRASVPTDYVKTLDDGNTADSSSGNNRQKISIEDRRLLAMFSQIQVEIVKAQPILFGKVRLELRLHVPEPAVANYVDGFKVRYRLLSSVRECSQTVNTPEQRSLYCSLTEDLRQLELLPDESDWQESLLPGRETGPSNLTAGVIDVRTPLSADVSLVKSMLTGLTPFSCYQLSAEAYSRVTAVTSRESPPARLLTLEDIPGRAPHNVRSFWTRQSGVNMLSLQWQLPPRYSWHGRILGVVVHLFANTSRLLLSSRRHNVSQRLLLLPGLDPVHSYSLHLSLYNCRGEGSRSPRIHIPASTTSSPGSGSLYEHQPWFVPLVVLATLFFWLLLCGLVVYLCCARCRSGGHDPASKFGKSHAPPPLPLYSHPQYHLEPLIKEVSVPSAAANTSSANNTGNHKSDALYSATSLVTSGSCTPYASASIIDAPSDTLNNTVLNNNGNSINTKFFTATSMDELNPGQLPGMPPYLTYAPYSHMSISSGPLLPYPPPPPPILPVVSTATAALAKDDPSGQKMIPGGAAGWPGGTVKMGLGHLPGSSSGASSSGGSGCARRHNGAATSSSNNSQQHQHPGNGTAALATMGSTPPACASSDWSLTAEGRDEASSKGRKSMGEESPKSTVHYDVIPNRDTEDDDSNDDSNDEDDCATSQTSTENNQYDLGSPPLGPDCSTTVPHQLQQHQPPGYSSDSVTYLSLPQKRRPPHKKKHLRQGNSTKIGATCFQKSKL